MRLDAAEGAVVQGHLLCLHGLLLDAVGGVGSGAGPPVRYSTAMTVSVNWGSLQRP